MCIYLLVVEDLIAEGCSKSRVIADTRVVRVVARLRGCDCRSSSSGCETRAVVTAVVIWPVTTVMVAVVSPIMIGATAVVICPAMVGSTTIMISTSTIMPGFPVKLATMKFAGATVKAASATVKSSSTKAPAMETAAAPTERFEW